MFPRRNRMTLLRASALLVGALIGFYTSLADLDSVRKSDFGDRYGSERKILVSSNSFPPSKITNEDRQQNLKITNERGERQGRERPLEPQGNRSILINSHPYTYILHPSDLCKPKPLIVLFLHSAPSKHSRRDIVRETWGNSTFHQQGTLRIVFVIGSDPDPIVQKSIRLENEVYGDILQENFLDSYKNLSVKVVGALGWVLENCPYTRFIVKTDDDVFVNVFSLIAHLSDLQRTNQDNDLLLCRVNPRMAVLRTGKWLVTNEEYSEQYYPPYCSGLAYIMTQDVAQRLYDASFMTRWMWVDDAWMTGIVAKEAKVKLTSIRKVYFLDQAIARKHFFGKTWYQYLFAHLGPKALREFWTELVTKGQTYSYIKQSKVVPGVVKRDL